VNKPINLYYFLFMHTHIFLFFWGWTQLAQPGHWPKPLTRLDTVADRMRELFTHALHSAKANEMQGGERRGTTYLVQRGVAEDDGALCWTTTLPPLASVFFFSFAFFISWFASVHSRTVLREVAEDDGALCWTNNAASSCSVFFFCSALFCVSSVLPSCSFVRLFRGRCNPRQGWCSCVGWPMLLSVSVSFASPVVPSYRARELQNQSCLCRNVIQITNGIVGRRHGPRLYRICCRFSCSIGFLRAKRKG